MAETTPTTGSPTASPARGPYAEFVTPDSGAAPAPTTAGTAGAVDPTPFRQAGLEFRNADANPISVRDLPRFTEYEDLTEVDLVKARTALYVDAEGIYRPQERQGEWADRLAAIEFYLRRERGQMTEADVARDREQLRRDGPLSAFALPAIPTAEQWDLPVIDGIRRTARDLNVPDTTVHAVLAHVARTGDQAPVDYATAEAQLRRRWGATYESHLEAAQLAYAKLPIPARAWLSREGYENDPRLVELFAAIGAPLQAGTAELRALRARGKDNPPTADELLAATRRAQGQRR
jgi:hypothetical protein